MKAKDLRERSTADLLELKGSMQKDLFSYRMKNCTGQLDDTSLLNKTKKDVARIELILHERSSAGGEAAATKDGGES
jgi:large subunit ribosomal protein L29